MIGTFAVIAFYVVVVAYSAAATLFFVELAVRRHARSAALGCARSPSAWRFSSCCSCPTHRRNDGSLVARVGLALCACSLSLSYPRPGRVCGSTLSVAVVAPLSLAMLVGAQFLRASGPVTEFPHTLLFDARCPNVLGVSGCFSSRGLRAPSIWFKSAD